MQESAQMWLSSSKENTAVKSLSFECKSKLRF